MKPFLFLLPAAFTLLMSGCMNSSGNKADMTTVDFKSDSVRSSDSSWREVMTDSFRIVEKVKKAEAKIPKMREAAGSIATALFLKRETAIEKVKEMLAEFTMADSSFRQAKDLYTAYMSANNAYVKALITDVNLGARKYDEKKYKEITSTLESNYFKFYDQVKRSIEAKYAVGGAGQALAKEQATDDDPLSTAKVAVDVAMKLYEICKTIVKERREELVAELETFKAPSWTDIK